MRAAPLLVLVALVAAGCTGHAPAPAASTAAAPTRATEPPVEPTLASRGRLDVTLDVQDRWIRPDEPVVATAHAPPGARVSWFLATRNPVPSLNWPHRAGDTTLVPAGATRGVTKLADPGRYVFALAGVPLLNVTVDPRLPPAAAASVDAVASEGGIRFVPDEASAGPGGLLVVRNLAASDVDLAERDWLGVLPVEGASVAFPMPRTIDLGDYELRAVAEEATGAVGEASAHLVFDTRKPDANATLGPFNGTLRVGAPAPAGDAPVEHSFASRFIMRELDVRFRASSQLPGPAAIVVQVVGPNGTVLDTSEPASEGSLALRDLPAGAYTIRVSGAQGALLSYSVDATARLVLVAPESFFGS